MLLSYKQYIADVVCHMLYVTSCMSHVVCHMFLRRLYLSLYLCGNKMYTISICYF